jgi:hypothetical protein
MLHGKYEQKLRFYKLFHLNRIFFLPENYKINRFIALILDILKADSFQESAFQSLTLQTKFLWGQSKITLKTPAKIICVAKTYQERYFLYRLSRFF